VKAGAIAAFLLAIPASGAETAVRVQPADLPGILWATGASDCTGSDLAVRQCRGIQAERARALGGKTFVAAGDAGALERIENGYVVRGCLRCDAAPAIVTRGSVTVAGDTVVGPELFRGAGPVPPAARVDLYFRLGPRLDPRLGSRLDSRLGRVDRWTQDGKAGVFVDPVGYRVYDGCHGDLVAASPATQAADRDEVSAAACGEGAPATAVASEAAPIQPTAGDVKTAMDAVAPEVARCFDRYGVPGTADVFVEVGGDGDVIYSETRGTFFDTPTGTCVAAAVRQARFPRFLRAPMRLRYPFLLR